MAHPQTATEVCHVSRLCFFETHVSPYSRSMWYMGGAMLIGYARTSTLDQVAGFEAQRRDLKAAGCKKVFAEQVSSVAEREQLMAALDYLRDGDVLTVTKLDRIARSVRDLMEIVHR